jgi:hypothetical protein
MKLIKTMILCICFVLSFSCISRADGVSAEVQEIANFCYTNYGISVSQGCQETIDSYWDNSANAGSRLYICCRNLGSRIQFAICDNMTENSANVTFNGSTYYVYSDSAAFNTSTANNVVWNFSDYPTHYFGSRSDFVIIDFETLYYNPNIPLPEVNVYLDQMPAIIPTDPTSYVHVAGNGNNDYYLQLGYSLSVPSMVTIGLADGQPTYRVDLYYENQTVFLYDVDDLHVANGLWQLDFNSAWQSAYNTLFGSNSLLPTFQSSVPAWQNNPENTKYLSLQSGYKEKLKMFPLFGTKVDIFARYYTVEDSQVYVGNWYHWQSDYPGEFTEELPYGYKQEGQLVPGTERTETQISTPGTGTFWGSKTGEQQTETVYVSDPRYPDYPTIASYNHDNILVTFIQTAANLPQMFGGFTSFLNSFMFVPTWIWDLIGFGFAASIVIMIIKIL